MEVNNALNPFVSFPIELNLYILSYVSDADLIKRISLVCRQFKELSNNSNQWKERTIRLCGKVKAEESFTKTNDWKLSYILRSKREESHRCILLKKDRFFYWNIL